MRAYPAVPEVEPGDALCGRAVPDGEQHRFDGAVIAVEPALASDLLQELDEGSPFTVIDLAAAQLRRHLDR